MTRRSIFWYLYPSYLWVTVLTLIVVAVYGVSVFRTFQVTETEGDLRTHAYLLKERILESLAGDEIPQLTKTCREFRRTSDLRVTVILPSGKVLCDSHEDPERMENHADRPEIMDAYKGREGMSSRYSETLKKELMYFAIPLQGDESQLGVLRVSVPMANVFEALHPTFLKIASVCVLVLLAAAFGGILLSRKISHPVRILKDGAVRFTNGDLQHRIHLSSFEEVSGLAEAMNHMAEQLEERLQTIVLQNSEQQAILASMVEGIIAIGREEKILNINESAAGMFHTTVAEAKGHTIQEAIRNSELQALVGKVKESDTTEEEITLSEMGRENRVLQAHGTKIRDSENKNIGVLLVLNDITHLRKLERVRRDFVANVSHELRTPLTSIKGFVETLLEGAKDSPKELDHFLDIIANHVNRLNSIIEDLLALSSIEKDVERKDVSLENVQLRPIIKEAVEVGRGKARAKHIRVELDSPDDIAVRINPLLIEQAIINLLDNAVKYSDEGTSVTVRASKDETGTHISVQDQGAGIAEKNVSRLFERFYRVDKARSRKLGGTGLGLAIVKHIMEAHHGQVTVESSIGKGSVFSLHLPA